MPHVSCRTIDTVALTPAVDTFAGYNWLYIGSLIFGLCAVVIALTFKPPAAHAARPGQPLPQAS